MLDEKATNNNTLIAKSTDATAETATEEQAPMAERLPPVNDKPLSPVDNKTNAVFWWVFFGVIFLLATITLLSEFMASKQYKEYSNKHDPKQLEPVQPLVQPASMPAKDVIALLLGDNIFKIPEGEFTIFLESINEKISDFGEKSQNNIDAYINSEVDAIFSDAVERVPIFLNWYYSLSGEYSRILSSVSSDMTQFMIDKTRETIFQPAEFEHRLDYLRQNLDNKVYREFEDLKTEIAQEVGEFITKNSVSNEIKDGDLNITSTVNFGELFSKVFNLTKKDVAILSGSALTAAGLLAGGKALGAIVIKSLIPKLLAMKAVQTAIALLTKLAIKAGLKGGGTTGAGTGGAIACSPLGPVAAGVCGAIAAIGAWILVDKAFINIDEYINRHDFEAELNQALITQRDETKSQLIMAYKTVLSQQYAAFRSQFQALPKSPTPNNFVPANQINNSIN